MPSERNPTATTGIQMIYDAAVNARTLRFTAIRAEFGSPLQQAFGRITRGVEFINRGAIHTGLLTFDRGFEMLQDYDLITKGD